jgi:hypothetical protein
MVKKPLIFYMVIFGIFITFILSLNLYIEKEKQKRNDNEVATELLEEQNVQNSARNYIMALNRQDIERYNSVVVNDLKINKQSLYFIKIMTNVISAKFLGDNLSVIHLKKEDRSTTLQVKYEITFPETVNPEGIYTNGKNKCRVFMDLIKLDNRWFITKIYNLNLDTERKDIS